jgi:hypothetical protein
VLFHLQRLRDEVHRFAIGAHRDQAQPAITASPAGRDSRHRPGAQAALLLHFGTAGKVRAASLEDLQRAPGVSAAVAQAVLLDMYSVTCKDIFGIAAPPQTTGRLVQPSAATYPGFAAIAGKTWRCSMTVPDYRDDMDDVLTFAVNVGFGVEKNFKVTGTIQFGVNFEGESSPRFATYQIGGWGYETQWSYGPYVKFYTTVNEMALPRGRWPTYPIQFYITKQADGTFQLSGQLDRASDLKRINLEYCSVITP